MSNADSGKRAGPEAAEVLDFWFGDSDDPANVKRRGKQWFAADESFDRGMQERFGDLHGLAQEGGLDEWRKEPRSMLALIVLLDQFTRNLYRGTASAFANDARALELCRESIDRKLDSALNVVERAFLYMPFQHSEDPEDQRQSVDIFRSLASDSPEHLKAFADNTYRYAVLHCEIIQQFGRFPHRNALLGRPSTDAERRYLDDGGQRFGQG